MSEQATVLYRASPRSVKLPMAFSGHEFLRGALAAWGYFLILITPGTVVYVVVLNVTDAYHFPEYMTQFPAAQLYFVVVAVIAAYVIVVPWSMVGLLLGATVAYGLGMALRRTDKLALHVAAFTFLGLVVGVATSVLGASVYPNSAGLTSLTNLEAVVIYSALAAVAVGLGWLFTASRALRADVREGRCT